MRNVELTKQRILEAATREFSDHGFAGARVDRIALQAGANKALIYSYFGKKEQLFEAVYRAIMNQVARDLPMDGADLPGYLARRLDWQFHNPDLGRLVAWGLLELDGFPKHAGMQATKAAKIDEIARAQGAGVIDAGFTPEQVLALIDALARPSITLHGDRTVPDADFQEYRRAAVESLRRILEPGSV